MFGLNAGHLLIVLAIVLILFGPKQLPKLGQMIGTTMKGIRDGAEGKDVEEEEAPKEVVKSEAASAGSPKSDAKAADEAE